MTPINYSECWKDLEELGLGDWRTQLEERVLGRMCDSAHGDFSKWREAIEELAADPTNEPVVREKLLALSPWRKGPFQLADIKIDAEWRSDLKWDRLLPGIDNLAGRSVLDVGSGNGYYALRMQEAGARVVIGVDPTILYVLQFHAVQVFRRAPGVHILPLRVEELPASPRKFDTTFSMGVLYHQRAPITHLRQLRDTLRPGGQLVLETIYIPGEESYARTPEDRYARMRNVWLLPTLAELTTWLSRTGFRDLEIVNCCRTTTDEQRSTEWMTFESLAEALNPEDPEQTVEGWPAPRRVVLVAKAP
jgi:tRNA (mo5U34)-methyltransferase